MSHSLPAVISALWLGIMTSISPCPLATNIAAVSFIGRQVKRPVLVALSGLLYTIGRALTYQILALLIIKSLLSAHALKPVLEDYVILIIGPVLIITGLLLMEVISLNFPGLPVTERLGKALADWNVLGALPMGVLFALSFCPVTMALFFGGLLPLALESHSSVLVPLSYGIGTALPVLVFAFLLSIGTRSVSKAFTTISRMEKVMRMGTGLLFAGIGIYFTLKYTFNLFG